MVDGALECVFESKPTSVKLWEAHSKKRDFRFGPHYPQFTPTELEISSHNHLRVSPEKSNFFKAFFLELSYEFLKIGLKFRLSTEVFVVGH